MKKLFNNTFIKLVLIGYAIGIILTQIFYVVNLTYHRQEPIYDLEYRGDTTVIWLFVPKTGYYKTAHQYYDKQIDSYCNGKLVKSIYVKYNYPYFFDMESNYTTTKTITYPKK